jgi:hypothetical protein
VTAREHIEFEDWLDFMFDRDNEAWFSYDIEHEPWMSRADLVCKHFVTLHMSAQNRLERFSNEQLGWGLKSLYIGTSAGEPLHVNQVGAAQVQQALLAVPHFLADIVANRCADDESDTLSDPLADVMIDFWDLVPLMHCLNQRNERERLAYQAMLEETRRSLRIDHSIAHFHALYGLGLFGRGGSGSVKREKTKIISDWLATKPKIGPRVRNFAETAAFSKYF